MKKIFFPLFLVVALAVAALDWQWRKTIARLQTEQSALEARELWHEPVRHSSEKKSRTPGFPDAAERTRISLETRLRYQQLWNDPAFVRLMLLRLRLSLDRQYGAFFRSESLPPGEVDRLKDALVEKQLALADARRLTRDQWSDAEQRDFTKSVTGEVDKALGAILGPERFSRYQAYEKTSPLRSRVTEIAERLAYRDLPLKAAEKAALLDALTREIALPEGALTYPPVTRFPARAMDRAEKILSPAQFQALREFDAEDRAIEALAQTRQRAVRPALAQVNELAARRP